MTTSGPVFNPNAKIFRRKMWKSNSTDFASCAKSQNSYMCGLSQSYKFQNACFFTSPIPNSNFHHMNCYSIERCTCCYGWLLCLSVMISGLLKMALSAGGLELQAHA